MTTGKITNPASKPFNAAAYLRDEESISEFIVAMLEGGDQQAIPATLRIVADAVGMTELSRRTGLDRSNLYVQLADGGNPRFDTLSAVAAAFGLEVALVRKKVKKASRNPRFETKTVKRKVPEGKARATA